MPPTLVIARADFASPALREFLQAHLDDIEPTAPPESRHALDLAALQAPHVRLWTARDGETIVGTAALAALEEPGHEELKSMRTDPERRGEGIAAALLEFVLGDARERGVERVSLETGSMAFFAPARRLYARAGFVESGPFGSYTDDPNSAFLTLAL
ncbi:GNAT family N-acetyltransferase [Leifsonia sp. NPDC102414]|uniref:GNAT family N-acetyltransferase n=1 Tax=Leifsonia sp. NPDC102414 TaxID=3364124 RepID=UPI00382D1031